MYPYTERDSIKGLLRDLPTMYGERDVFRIKEQDGSVRGVDASQFQQLVAGFGAGLKKLNLLDGRTAIVGPNSLQWIVTYFAVTGGDGVIVPVDPDLPAGEIGNILRRSSAQTIVYAPELEQVMTELRNSLPDVKCFIPIADMEDGSDTVSFNSVIRLGRDGEESYMQITPSPDKMCTILYTSGTTGAGKGVMLTSRGLMTSATSGLAYISLGRVTMAALPMHHTYGFSIGILMYMSAAVTICLNDSPRYFFQNLRLFQPDTIMLVPLYVDLIHRRIWSEAQRNGTAKDLEARLEESRKHTEYDSEKRKALFPEVYDMLGGKLEYIVSGGAPLKVSLADEFEDFGLRFSQGYGITECSPLVAVNPDRAAKNSTVGPAIPCCEVRLEDVDENGNGELCVRGSNVMLGYYENPGATADSIRDGWFRTGDLASIDDDGYITITGRSKNLIVLSNGKNVMPDEIEEYLLDIPYVYETIVYAPETDDGETTLFAQVYPDDETRDKYDAGEIRAMLERDIAEVNRRLPVYKQIADFYVREKPFEKTTKQSIKRFRAIEELSGKKGGNAQNGRF